MFQYKPSSWSKLWHDILLCGRNVLICCSMVRQKLRLANVMQGERLQPLRGGKLELLDCFQKTEPCLDEFSVLTWQVSKFPYGSHSFRTLHTRRHQAQIHRWNMIQTCFRSQETILVNVNGWIAFPYAGRIWTPMTDVAHVIQWSLWEM